MYFTHHFSNHDTLARARYWLSRLGFRPDEVKHHDGEAPRISLSVASPKVAGARLILEAIATDVSGIKHAFWTTPPEEPAGPTQPGLKCREWGASPIGWHPQDCSAPVDLSMQTFCEWRGRSLS